MDKNNESWIEKIVSKAGEFLLGLGTGLIIFFIYIKEQEKQYETIIYEIKSMRKEIEKGEDETKKLVLFLNNHEKNIAKMEIRLENLEKQKKSLLP